MNYTASTSQPNQQEEFGEFFEAPKAATISAKKEEKKTIEKGTLLDDAADILDMDNLMKVTSSKNDKPNNPGDPLYSALYSKPGQFKY